MQKLLNTLYKSGIAALCATVFALSVQNAFAVSEASNPTPTLETIDSTALPTPPAFTSCDSPKGTKSVSYSGAKDKHGIVGIGDRIGGVDSVYQITDKSNAAVTQCFCPSPSDSSIEGIQTNWWSIPFLTSDQIKAFIDQKWILQLKGQDWGLDANAYLAKNSTYTCNSLITPSTSPTTTPLTTPQPTSGSSNSGGSNGGSSSSNNNTNASNNSTSSSSSSSITKPGQVLGTKTLANTGEFSSILSTMLFGIGILMMGMSGVTYVKNKKS